MSIWDPFLIRAALAAAAVALAAGPLGCFVLWRRMAYLGDATAHAAILGVALALAAEIPVFAGVLALALAVGWAAGRATGRGLAPDAVLGVWAHAGLALGLIAAAFVPAARVDLEAFLFGDVLAVGPAELPPLLAACTGALGLLVWRWRPLVTATLAEDLAAAEGVDPARERVALTVGLALLVAAGIQVVGALLITALLIVPAAAARPLSRTPEGMALTAGAIGVASALAGLEASARTDAPAGPSVVAAALAALLLAQVVARLRRS